MDRVETITSLVKELLEKMSLDSVPVEVVEEDETIRVNLKTEEPGLLIGFHGKTLSSFQLILGLMVFRKLGEWQKLVVDVNDYRQEQTERIRKIALSAAQRARFAGQAVALSPMTPFERRVVHLALSEREDVETCSEGEGGQRYVIITPIGLEDNLSETTTEETSEIDRSKE